jgi:HAE1 family hydrophobic/amphiphilic exporter-1
MGEEDVGRRIELGIQWNGAYSLEQMESEVKRVEALAGREPRGAPDRQIYSYYGEQGLGGLQIQFARKASDLLGSRQVMEKIREELPKSARATSSSRHRGGPGVVAMARRAGQPSP